MRRSAVSQRVRPEPAGRRRRSSGSWTGHLGYPDRRRRRCSSRSATGSAGRSRRSPRANGIPILRLKKPDRSRWDDRKLDHVRPYLDAAERDGPLRGGRHRGRPGVPVGVQRAKQPLDHRRRRVFRLRQDRAPGRRLLLLRARPPTSGPGSSRSAPTSRIRPRCGSTATSGPNAKPTGPASPSPAWPTGSPPATTPTRCRRSATGSGPATCRRSSTAGSPSSPPRSPPPTGPAGYWWELSMRQVEVSRTLVFDDPRRARAVLRSAGRRQRRHRPPRRGGHASSAATAAAAPPSTPSGPGSSGPAPT